MDEYVCVTVLSGPAEAQLDFASRLSQFWTHMLRNHKEDFGMVYAEKTGIEHKGNRLGRQYLVRDEVLPLLEQEMAKEGVEHEPIARDDTYTKYEAVAPEWMQIEH